VNVPSSAAALAGAYRLRPGRRPAIAGDRPVLAAGRLAALLQERPAHEAPAACAAVFTLCAHAHRRTSAAAIAAASDRALPADDGVLLALETARDHLRAVALDWPARAHAAPELAWLQGSPLRIAGPASTDAAAARATLRALAAWLEERVLGEPPAAWLARCAEPQGLHAWCERQAATLPPARWLLAWHGAAACAPLPGTAFALLEADPPRQQAQLRELAAALAGDAGFAQRPLWRGAARENGPWTRTGTAAPASAWLRLAARWRELVQLAASAEASMPVLRSGALALGAGEALAWCEMARGLLFHWVRLEGDAVQDYRVLAPTEWNFHPEGSLARALERLEPADAPTAALLAAAFDPCVPCTVVAAD
jgi:hypothetical protein